jgi:uncharacterized membrane protein YidH (DUF202 family)
MTESQRPRPPGLQAERTQLSWERTAIGFLAVGAIVLFRHDGPLATGRTVVAVATLLIALTVFGIARTRRMRDCARTEVLLVGLSTVALAVVLAAMVLWFG